MDFKDKQKMDQTKSICLRSGRLWFNFRFSYNKDLKNRIHNISLMLRIKEQDKDQAGKFTCKQKSHCENCLAQYGRQAAA